MIRKTVSCINNIYELFWLPQSVKILSVQELRVHTYIFVIAWL